MSAFARDPNMAPHMSARAQAQFDCWVEQAEEGHQTDHIAACRTGFLNAMLTWMRLWMPPTSNALSRSTRQVKLQTISRLAFRARKSRGSFRSTRSMISWSIRASSPHSRLARVAICGHQGRSCHPVQIWISKIKIVDRRVLDHRHVPDRVHSR